MRRATASLGGDESRASPTLNTVRLHRTEAARLFERTLWNVEMMLNHDCVHGDLSAYNILYWDGRVTLIDFPQAVDPHDNPGAERLLRRDVLRVCDYFASQGVDANPRRVAKELWDRYFPTDLWPALHPVDLGLDSAEEGLESW